MKNELRRNCLSHRKNLRLKIASGIEYSRRAEVGQLHWLLDYVTAAIGERVGERIGDVTILLHPVEDERNDGGDGKRMVSMCRLPRVPALGAEPQPLTRSQAFHDP